MNIGLGIGIPFTRSSLWASIFTPSALFLDGSTQGVWYDPSDINLTWRRNLLTYSEQFDNAAWIKGNATVTPNAVAAPDGTLTADKLIEDSSSGFHSIFYSGTNAVGVPVTATIFLKAAERTYARISDGATHTVLVDLSTGVASAIAGSPTNITSVNRGNGWYAVSFSFTPSSASSRFYVFAIQDSLTLSYQGDGTSGIYIWGAQLEQGSTATAYQRITDGIQDYLQYQAQPVLYRDAAGTQPVTAVEQPVGLMLDKSKGLVLGPELVTNGDFSQGLTSWSADASVTTVAGQAVFTNTPSGTGLAQNLTSAAVGKNYAVGFDIVSIGAVSAAVRIGGTSFVFFGTAGRKNLVFSGLAASTTIQIFSAGNGGNFTIDNISVRELPGNHAFNPSGNSANFPVLSARYNLLTKTEEFSDAAWGKNAGVSWVSKAIAPNGTNTADKIDWTGAAAGDGIYQGVSGVAAGAAIFKRIYIRADVSGSVKLSNPYYGAVSATVTVTTSWQEFTYTQTPSGTLDGMYIQKIAGGPSVIYIWGADLRVVNDALNQPAYQRVNTATDYDTVGFKPYVRFNGVNQWLQTNSIDFSYTDKMFVSAGVRKLSDPADAVALELGPNANATNGTFAIGAPVNSGAQKYDYKIKGTTAVIDVNTTNANFAAPVTSVVSGISSISTDVGILRVNGTQAASSTADQGTGNYGNYPLYIGARAGTSLWFNGRLYQLVIAAGSEIRVAEEDSDLFLSESGDFITAETTVAVIQSAIEQTEAFVNRKTSAF